MKMNRAPAGVGRGKAGFSLLELIVVVAVIMILAAVAIPNLLKSKMAANESAAAGALRSLATEEVNYDVSYQGGFSSTLAQLGPPPSGTQASATNADLIDQVLAAGTRSGYTFVYTPSGSGPVTGYKINANPISPGTTGQWYFYVDQTNVIRREFNAPAGPTSTPLPQ
ncbi:MAG TPA: type II secretion system protein [Candidatus Acidoferrales bacterium]|nr:type II secretion system protein [Candidatus Acidoferrales bacterium]